MSVDPARQAAHAVAQAIERRVREVATSALVVIKTVNQVDSIPRTVDVALKHAPGIIIPGVRITFQSLDGHVIVPTIQEGDVYHCHFTYVPLDDLVVDKEPRALERHARWHSVIDAVLGDRVVTDNEVLASPPSGYDSARDLLVMDKDGHGIWLRGSDGRIVLGNLKGTLKRVAVQGDTVSGGVVQAGSSNVWVGQ